MVAHAIAAMTDIMQSLARPWLYAMQLQMLCQRIKHWSFSFIYLADCPNRLNRKDKE
jgi:hypothetical protein